ncbi:hypothetical protein DPMN_028075 [Dreissena polymorpha]|uniref:Secreted protein n=1 Tax=Dreissena polymorpha TaxID=45954 RepID=A0A9D4RFT1_DREPO|nr:hypothetical protein DPMN_028075 [Dreissena polymorpha]
MIIGKNLTYSLLRVLVILMQNMHHSLPMRWCLSEAEEDFPQNIVPLVIIQKSRQVLEHYLSTRMPCQLVLHGRNVVVFLVFSFVACLGVKQKIRP